MTVVVLRRQGYISFFLSDKDSVHTLHLCVLHVEGKNNNGYDVKETYDTCHVPGMNSGISTKTFRCVVYMGYYLRYGTSK